MTETTQARLSSFEITYLLSGRSDERASTARGILGLPSAGEAATWEASGYASLDLRGLLGGEGDGILPHNWVGMVGHTLGTAAHWVAIHVRDTTEYAFQLFVQGSRATLLVARDAPNTWSFVGVDSEVPLADLAVRFIEAYADSRPLANVMVRSISPVDDRIRSIFLKRTEDEWELGRDPVFPGDEEWPAPDIELEDVTREQALGSIAAVLEPHAVPVEGASPR